MDELDPIDQEVQQVNTILLVDDNPTNLEVLYGALNSSGYEVLVSLDGESAIEQAEYTQPDLILLDIMMPGIDGFETCRLIKANHNICDIPIVFMTALTDTVDKVRGFHLGAVDYITKPFKQEEVIARIETHLKIRNLTKQLISQNIVLKQEVHSRTVVESLLAETVNHLEERVAERTAKLLEINRKLQDSESQLRSRTQQLEQSLCTLQQTQMHLMHTEKMSSLGQLVAGIAHEINNPVNFIYGNIFYANEYTGHLLKLLFLYQQYNSSSAPEIQAVEELIDLEFLQSDLLQIFRSMKSGAERIREIVLSLRSFSRLDESDMKIVDIHAGINDTLMLLQHRLKSNSEKPEINLVKEYGHLPPVECYPGQLNQVFMNILTNAIDAVEELVIQGEIYIVTQRIAANQIIVRIADNGVGMSELVRQRIFDPFFTTKATGKGIGMGLAISYQIITEKHRGTLQCFARSGGGTEFVISIPVTQKSGNLV